MMGYYWRMKSKTNFEYEQFTGALRKVLRVSRDKMKAKLSAEKQEKKQQPKRASDHASRGRD
jgi:hypothetical protein